MQYLNDDMDELYRRAAEEYPLNTNGADWNAVLKKLSASSGEPGGEKQNNNKYKRLLLLLLLLPLAWLGKNYFYSSPGQKGNSSFQEQVSTRKSPSNFSPVDPLKQEPYVTPSIIIKKIIPSGYQVFKNEASLDKDDHGKKEIVMGTRLNQSVINGDTHNIKNEPGNDQQAAGNELTVSNNDDAIPPKSNEEAIQPLNKINEKSEVVPANAKKEKSKKVQGFYAGITVSPDISFVKFQSVKNTGISVGILLGYRLNKRVSLESGISWDKKYYNSDGKYFNANKITLLPYAKIKDLEGSCEMLEVPVTIRYKLTSSEKRNLTFSAGVSSYIMKNENYTYTIERNGVLYPRTADYSNSSTDVFAVANVGIGYNHRVGKSILISIEPYIKMPLKGVGIGNLPIMSTGMHIGVIKSFFKK